MMCAVLVAGLWAHGAHAHDARPLLVNVVERGEGRYAVRLRAPPSVEADNQPQLMWPADCRIRTDPSSVGRSAAGEAVAVSCPGGLTGRRLAVRYPLYNPSLPTLFRLRARDGDWVTQMLPPDRLDWQVPGQAGAMQVAIGYLNLGIRHIWSGFDHLLFVAGLLLLAGSTRRLLLAVSGFTLAHSITLSAAVVGLVGVPVAPVEAAIALSILFLAREIARPRPDGLARRYPLLVASSFGLLHGFGFAAGLQSVGLPRGELALGLLSFNLGVEAGQILFIAALLGAYFGGARWLLPARRWIPAAGYVLGLPAAMWFIQRASVLLA